MMLYVGGSAGESDLYFTTPMPTCRCHFVRVVRIKQDLIIDTGPACAPCAIIPATRFVDPSLHAVLT